MSTIRKSFRILESLPVSWAPMTRKDAKTCAAEFGVKFLLTTETAKTDKDLPGVRSAIMFLRPHASGGRGNVCPFAKECAKDCLASAGRLALPNVVKAQQNRTDFLAERPQAFLSLLLHELETLRESVRACGDTLALRLNGLSDLPWHRVEPLTEALHYGDPVRWYEYTKVPEYVDEQHNAPDYRGPVFTFSVQPSNVDVATSLMEAYGTALAIVFAGDVPVATTLMAYDRDGWPEERYLPVIDGDANDHRFHDPIDCVIGLSAKGTATREGAPMVMEGSAV